MTHTPSRIIRLAALLLALLVLSESSSAQRAKSSRKRSAVAARGPKEPQELHGSKESVEKMYAFATSHHMPFYLTPTTLDSAIAHGRLFPLMGDATYDLTRGVGFAYATHEARDFVIAFAPQYLAACGTPLTVTSAARPMSRQPHNANPHSVHPAGIAVDIRRPPPGKCLTWVRGALTELERRNVVEATEEHHPVHIHLAVLVAPGSRVTLPNLVPPALASRTTEPFVIKSSGALAASGDIGLRK